MRALRALPRALISTAFGYLALSAVNSFIVVKTPAAHHPGYLVGRAPGSSRGRPIRAVAEASAETLTVEKPTDPTVVERARKEVTDITDTGRPVENRKLRAAIESIELDQESLRMSTPLLSMKTILAAGSAAGLSALATLAAASPELFVWLPPLTTVIFLYSSLSESAAGRYRAKSKYNYAQASRIAALAESSLAGAEARTVFFPFGVGLTAITAAACVSLRIFNEKIGDFLPEGESFSTLLAGDNIILILLATTSVVGAVLTSLTYVSTRAALVLDESIQSAALSDWEAGRLPKRAKEPTQEDERNVVLATIFFCIVPIPFIVSGVDFSLASTNPLLFNKGLQQLLDDASVVISASAAAQAAVAFLLGEKDFTDAEQRCAMQSKQAALSEMFCAQAQQEAAIIPVRSAMSAAARGAADLVVEFSRLAAVLFPWGSVQQAFQSILNTKLVRVETDAATNEARMVKYGPKVTRNRGAIDSSLVEIGRLQKEVFPSDSDMRDEIAGLKVGETKIFKIRSKEGRREVHLTAAELGMVSQSKTTQKNQRVVEVKNMGRDALADEEIPTLAESLVVDVLEPVKKEAQTGLTQGIPQEWSPWITSAAAAAASVQAAPAVLGADASQVVLPLVTGGIGLLTVWQERVGREQVAYAKKDAALLQQRHAEAEALCGLAALSASALPTYVAVAAVAGGVAAVGFLGNFGGAVGWACEMPTLIISMLTLVLALERQELVEKYILGAARVVGGKPPQKAWLRAQRLWLLIPVLVMLLPETLIRRCCAANALITAELGFVLANCARQLSFGEYYAARTRRVHSRTDAWAQVATACSRSLPLTSALALTNTLISTTLGAVSVSFGGIFPIFGLAVCIRAVQKAVESRESAVLTRKEGRDAQQLGQTFPPYSKLDVKDDELVFESPTVGKRIREDLKMLTPNKLRSGFGRLVKGFMRIFSETKPEKEFADSPATKVVKRVQADLEELRVTVRGNEQGWLRVGSVVGILTGASILAPFLLSELLTEVIVPLAGTVLTVFVVFAESEARSSVAQAKVHAAQLNEQMSTMEELVSISSLWKSYLMAMVGIADCNAILGLVLHSKWNAVKWHSVLIYVQNGAQLLVAFSSIVITALAARRMLQVREWARSVEKIAADNFDAKMLSGIRQTSPMAVDAGGGVYPLSKRQKLFVMLAAVLPPLLLLVFPMGEELGEKCVDASGAAALVVALTMVQAERISCQAERTTASCKRAASLCEAFANRAEQQGALLPFNSAVAIAIAGVITFVTELSPVTAAALTVFQAMSWLVASRKGVAAKFESRASLQVRSRFSLRGISAATGTMGQRFKSFIIS
ncbi:unnamed protein product [Symbiodinium natans]|uniref:Uncharacterized protein n=1 Tax=Symbiodinium natans TaxID=878477 RepID=A0A812K8Z6_9DINO|nr:unnamed protein product [Symbiodinium natans]